MDNIVLCSPFYAYLNVGEQYLKFEKWCKTNNIKKNTFRPITINGYVRLIVISDESYVRKFAEDNKYNIVELFYSTKLNTYSNGIKILDKYTK